MDYLEDEASGDRITVMYVSHRLKRPFGKGYLEADP